MPTQGRLRAAATLLVLAASTAPLAAGPPAVASIDRRLWPEELRSPAAFDAASFAENVLFARAVFEALAEREAGTLDLGVKLLHPESIETWRKRTVALVAANVGRALAGCAGRELCAVPPPAAEAALEPFARAQAPALERRYPAWAAEARRFYATYAREQLRLAALFPAPTSEILRLSVGERLGDELPDRSFLLTFDDGPTAAGEETDRLADLLRGKGISGLFFVLDGALRARAAASTPEALAALYAGQCVGSHGREHKPHPALATWKESVDVTRALIAERLPLQAGGIPFRPPYGQRTAEQVKHVEGKGDAVVLWNIDSQDWSPKLAPERVGDRVATLMLLWRRGIVLFHDVHPKARTALPAILETLRGSGVVWKDCRAP